MRKSRMLAIAVGGVACATAGLVVSNGSSSADPVVTEAAVAHEEADALLSRLAEEAPPGQRATLAGGVTFDEYRRALVAGRECAVEKLAHLRDRPGARFAVEASELAWSGDRFRGTYTVGLRWTDPSGVTPELRAELAGVQRECSDSHVRWVESAYQVGFLAGDAFDAAAGSFRSCAESAGLELRASDPRTAVVALLDELDAKELPAGLERCLTEHPSVLGDPRPPSSSR